MTTNLATDTIHDGLSYRRARALIRQRVRSRLQNYHGDDIWETAFFIDRIDLAEEAFTFQSAQHADGRPISIADLVLVVREEFLDFIALEDVEARSRIIEPRVELHCEKCGQVFSLPAECCPGCRYIFQIAERSLDEIADDILSVDEVSDPIRRRMIENTYWSRMKASYDRLVTSFETFYKRLNSYIPFIRRVGGVEVRKNELQNVDRAQEWFRKNYNYEILKSLTPAEINCLKLLAQKRHSIQHNQGLIDQSYVMNVTLLLPPGSPAPVISMPIPIEQNELVNAIDYLRRIVSDAKSDFG